MNGNGVEKSLINEGRKKGMGKKIYRRIEETEVGKKTEIQGRVKAREREGGTTRTYEGKDRYKGRPSGKAKGRGKAAKEERRERETEGRR